MAADGVMTDDAKEIVAKLNVVTSKLAAKITALVDASKSMDADDKAGLAEIIDVLDQLGSDPADPVPDPPEPPVEPTT